MVFSLQGSTNFGLYVNHTYHKALFISTSYLCFYGELTKNTVQLLLITYFKLMSSSKGCVSDMKIDEV